MSGGNTLKRGIEEDRIQDDAGPITYELHRANRKTLSIHIGEGGKVVVKAPDFMSRSQVRSMLTEKISWIRKKVEEIQKAEAASIKHRFAQGEPFLYLGRTYPLHIDYDQNIRRICVMLNEDQFVIMTPTLDVHQLEAAVIHWYMENGRKLMDQRMNHFAEPLKEYPAKLIVKSQKSRWGSCSSSRELRMNWKLMMAPPKVLDYVIVHELCHLKHMNHSVDFWKAVEAILPDYKKQRQWLKKNGHMLEFNLIK